MKFEDVADYRMDATPYQETTQGRNMTRCQDMTQCQIFKAYAHLKKECAKLRKLSMKDELTGYYNYSFLMNTLNCEIERTKRSGLSTSIIMADIDHFKRINDEFGHESGNTALQWVTRIWRENIRKMDFPCRYGGEEFVFILPNEILANAVTTAERLRKKLEQRPLMLDKTYVTLTASFGVGEYSGIADRTAKDMIAQVDTLLYRAKESGRNRTCYDRNNLRPRSEQLSVDERYALFQGL